MAPNLDSSPQTLRLLAALLEQPDGWHYGYELSRRTGLRSGTLYPILVRLADRGWLETRWAQPERPGRPARHTYRLTPSGRELARQRVRSTSASPQPRAAAWDVAG